MHWPPTTRAEDEVWRNAPGAAALDQLGLAIACSPQAESMDSSQEEMQVEVMIT
jgi:hypothetical protein